MKTIRIEVDIAKQKLIVYEGDILIKKYQISTALNGPGELKDSYCTPRGHHIIRAKIGENAPLNAVFKERRFTGEVYSDDLKSLFPNRDWILTRILWLSGLEVGKNRLGKCDTMRRYIYIHGTHDENSIGSPLSKGCIRMLNKDIIELFNIVPVGSKVLIHE